MAWHRSAWRRQLTSRALRHRFARMLAKVAPDLARSSGFFGAGVAVEHVATRRLLLDETRVEGPLRADQIAYIREKTCRNDGPLLEEYWKTPWLFRDEFFEIEGPYFLGHTGRLADPDLRAVITDHGAPANQNYDKFGKLAEVEPLDAIALPVHRYKNYFHIMLEIALPLIVYFDSGQAPDEKHCIITMRGQPAYVTETLRALAKAYDLDYREAGRGDRVRCRRAVQLRRARPCLDWYPARPETARRLRDILLAHVGRAPEPPHAGLFLHRVGAKVRNLSNEAETQAAMTAEGLETFAPRAENFPDQIAKSAGARKFVSVHGAALTNMLFADPGARVVELFSDNSVKSVYLALCQMLGHEHHAVVCGPGDADQNFAADIDAIRAALADAPAP